MQLIELLQRVGFVHQGIGDARMLASKRTSVNDNGAVIQTHRISETRNITQLLQSGRLVGDSRRHLLFVCAECGGLDRDRLVME
jgi:hypothetical protein